MSALEEEHKQWQWIWLKTAWCHRVPIEGRQTKIWKAHKRNGIQNVAMSDRSHVFSTMLERSLISSLTKNLIGNFELFFFVYFLEARKILLLIFISSQQPLNIWLLLLLHANNLWHYSRVQMHSHVKSQPCTDPFQHIQHTDLVT